MYSSAVGIQNYQKDQRWYAKEVIQMKKKQVFCGLEEVFTLIFQNCSRNVFFSWFIVVKLRIFVSIVK